MEIRKVKYPYDKNIDGENDWYKFGQSEGAVKISDERIEKWVNDSINCVKEQLENGVKSPYSYTASGDTIVICFYSQDCEEDVFDDDNYFVVIVAKNYEEGNFFISDLKKKEEVEYKEDKLKVLQARIDELQAELLEEMTKKKGFLK